MTLSSQAHTVSQQIEHLMVSRNLRGMADVQHALTSGYYGRAAELVQKCLGTVLIGTGFPVVDTFETDGPVGTIALYNFLQSQGANPIIVGGSPLIDKLAERYNVYALTVGPHDRRKEEAEAALAELKPELIISIERPGMAADGNYYNMRGEDISPRVACFDSFLQYADCPSIAIGDGGNEIGMGNITEALQGLNIVPAATQCTELLIADVSNWGALGLIAMISWMQKKDGLLDVDSLAVLEYLSGHGSVDGVTRENELTEDGLPAQEGIKLIEQLRVLTGFSR
jgi:hypothetical protein